jgi:hypothetical protein
MTTPTEPRAVLLNCPFCDGPARVIEDDSYGGCSVSCGCEAEPHIGRPIGKLGEAIGVELSYAWVVEGGWSETCQPDYWAGASTWSGDHLNALRFSRKEDAQQAADLMLSGMNIRICEHAWG